LLAVQCQAVRGMPSFAQRRTFTCAACGKTAEAEIWLIVDATELPHAIEQLRLGTLHQVSSPSCAAPVEVDAPVLLYRPGCDPTLIFLPAKQTLPEEDQRDSHDLFLLLRNRLGAQWRDGWTRPFTSVSQEMARFVFSEEAQGWHPMDVRDLANKAWEFIQCGTWSDARAMVHQHSKLLTPLTDKILEQLAKDRPNAAANAAAFGITQADIAEQLKIDEKTLRTSRSASLC
jgi:CpXC protein